MFEVPLVNRLLLEALRECCGAVDSYLEFALWAIADVPARLPLAAEATIKMQAEDGIISEVDPVIVKMCKEYAPSHWLQLLELHLRHCHAPTIFQDRIRARTYPLGRISHPWADQAGTIRTSCSDGESVGADVKQHLMEARTVTALQAVRDGDFGLTCGDCIKRARRLFAEHFIWLRTFSSSYILKE